MPLAMLGTFVLSLSWATAASPTTETFAIRGRQETLHVYGARGGPVALVASGDGGWEHLAPHIAEFLASSGYFVVGLDSKAYLSSFTKNGTTLSTADVPRDFAALVDHARGPASSRPVVVGISEGAGLSILAATDDAVKTRIAGVVAVGLPDKNELGWRLRDSIIYVTKGVPDEPLFSAAEVIDKVAPLPVAAIHSTRDEFVPVAEIQRIMDRAGEPKRLTLVAAANHRFGGDEAEMDRRLTEAIQWIEGRQR
jgi:alpha-beta hydrolase superfamily lysophospholipase